MHHRAVFLDRDDTLMVNVPYLGDPALVRVFPDAAVALRALREVGFLLFVVSNQSGVGRGLISKEQVAAVTEEMHRQLGENFFAEVYNSYSSPHDATATDRKPSPELLFRAAAQHGLDLAKSYFIGDRLSDIQCGLNAGCRSIFLKHPHASREENPVDDPQAEQLAAMIVTDLVQAVIWILAQNRK